MAIDEHTSKFFHRRLYSGKGMLQTTTCLKRDDDQQEGTVRAVKLFQTRWSILSKSGEPIHGDWAVGSSRTLHVPRISMERAGIAYFNAADRFVDRDGRVWEPESTTSVVVKLLECHVCIQCKRLS